MADIASLGFEIDSSQAVSATGNLDKMTAAGDRAAAGSDRVAQKARAAGAGFDVTTASAKAVFDALNKADYAASGANNSFEKLQEAQKALSAAMKSGALGANEYATASAAVGVRAGELNKGLAATEKVAHGAANGIKLTSFQMMEFGRIIKDLATGQTAMLQRSSLTLAGSMGLMGALFTGAGLAIAGVVAIIGTAIYAYAKYEHQQAEFANALLLTNNYAATSTAELTKNANAIGAATKDYGDATTALTELAKSGKFTGDALTIAAQGAVEMSKLTGDSIEKTVKEFEKLAADPVKTLVDLNAQWHSLTVEQVEQVQALVDLGDKTGAVTLATKYMYDETDKRFQQHQEHLGAFKKSWEDVKGAIGGSIAQLGAYLDRVASVKGVTSTIVDVVFNPVGTGFDLARDAQRQKQSANVTSGSEVDEDTAAQMLNNAAKQKANDILIAHSQEIAKDNERMKEHALVIDHVSAVELKRQKIQNELNATFKLGTAAFADNAAAWQEATDKLTASFAPMMEMAKNEDALAKLKKVHAVSTKELAREQNAYNSAVDAAARFMVKLAGATDPVAVAYGHYTNSMIESAKIEQDLITTGEKLHQGDQARAQAAVLHAAAQQAAYARLGKELQKIVDMGDVLGKFLAKNKNDAAFAALTPRAQALAKAVDEVTAAYNKNVEAGVLQTDSLQFVQAGAEAAKAAEYDAAEAGKELNKIISEFGRDTGLDSLIDKLHKVQKELEKAKNASKDAFDPAYVKKLETAVDNLHVKMTEAFVKGSIDALHSMQAMTQQGSKGYKELQLAIDALTLAQAILAFVHQLSEGDVYSAIPRAVAVVAAMSSVGVDIGGLNANYSGAESSASRQASQGSGTILGDAKAQSDSIAKAVVITADATQQLVGINRGMLVALQALQNALGAAGVQLARGAGDAKFPAVVSATGLGLDSFTQKISSFLFGGSKKVIDEGIVIFGGALNDMLTGIAVGAYQTIHTSGGLFGGSGSTKDQTQGVPDEFTKQFQLVIGSIVDAVTQGALALGISREKIDAAIAAYHIAEQHISLKGLSAADQQKALEAVFSSIFDGLAGAVVPFIAQFQKVGEGLGETLIRVATEVQVTQEAMKSLGLAIATTDPEKFAQIADALVNAVGGIDEFITGMNKFVNHFASDKDKFKLEQDALTSAFGQVGLSIPPTREGMYALMRSLDASTESGRAQIATLLRLADVADAYYTAIDKAGTAQAQAADAYTKFIAQFQNILTPMTKFETVMRGLDKTLADNIKHANDLAVANGKSGASAADIGTIIAASIQQGVAALKQLQDETTALVGKLFGTTLDHLKADEAEFEKSGAVNWQRVKQIKDLENQQGQQQKLQDAVSLLANLGQISAITGQSLPELAKAFGIPLDQLAKILGTDSAGLGKDFTQQEALARAALDTANNTKYTNDLLKDILAQSLGKPLPISYDQLGAEATPVDASTGTIAGGKIGGPIRVAPPGSGTKQPGFMANAPVTGGTAQPPDGTRQVVDATHDSGNAIVDEIRSLRFALIGSHRADRNERPVSGRKH